MPLFENVKVIRKRLWLILLLSLLGGSVALYSTQRQIPQYRSTTTLFLNPAVANSLLTYQRTTTLESLSETYSEFMRTRSFAERVAEKLDGELSTGRILGSISTAWVRDTQFYRISATSSDPQLAQKLATLSAQVLIDENINRQQAQQLQATRNTNQEQQADRSRLEELQSALQNELTYYIAQIQVLQTQITELQEQPQSEERDQQLANLRGSLRDLQSLRVGVLSSLTQAQATLATRQDVLTANVDTAVIVDAAPLPGSPLPIHTVEYTVLGAIAALILGVVIAFLLEYIDYTIRTPEALDSIYGMSTLGVVGVVASRAEAKSDKKYQQIVSLADPMSPSAEAFRSLRTSIEVASLRSPIRTLLTTSAGPGEGKSFVTANLAVSLANNGHKVILVDADLRKPTQHGIFGVRRMPGFTDLVINQDATLDQVLQETPVENLSFLACGTRLPNPAELLSSPRAAEVMEYLKQNADIVVYDSPPAATVTDAIVLATRIDAVIQVVGAGQTRINHVLRCKTLLDRVGAHIIGPILNRVTLNDLGYYSYYYYGYYGQSEDEAASDGDGTGGNTPVSSRRSWPWSRRPARMVGTKTRVDAK